MDKTEKALLLNLFYQYAKQKASGRYKEADKIEADFLNVLNALSLEERAQSLKEGLQDLKKRLQDRLFWIADRLEDTIEARKKAGTYKGEFTIPVILANAFNDIFKVSEGYFTGDKNELKREEAI